MRIAMTGTGTFAEPTFRALLAAGEDVVGLVTQPDRDAGRPGGSTRQTGEGMAAVARAAGIPVIQPPSLNAPDGVAALRALAPDLLVVAAYGQILKPDALAVPPLGAINVHASLLPKYRGASPVAHAILGGEAETGVTIIRITLGLDAGEMLAQESLAILSDETAGELEARLAPLGARLCLDVVRQLKAGPVRGVPQDPALVTKAPKLTKERGLIDWARPAVEVARHVRAMQPWPTAYTFLHRPGKPPLRLALVRTAEVPGEAAASEPGTPILAAPRGTLRVACGGGTALDVADLVPAGKKRMPAGEFLRGCPMQPGFRVAGG